MKKQLIPLAAILFYSAGLLQGQVLHAQWMTSTKKVNDCEYDIVFTVFIEKGWHIFSSVKTAVGDEVFPTAFTFKPSKGYALVGTITESKPVSEYDPTIGKTVLQHFNKATFTQRIKLVGQGPITIRGTHEYQICDNTKCDFPPKDDFKVDLSGVAACR